MNPANFARIVPLAQQATPQVENSTTQPGSAPPASQPAIPKPFWAGDWMPLILALLVLYFVVFRSKNKGEKTRVQMLKSLKRGDRIQTIGGILGTVVDVRDSEVVVKVDETSNTKMTFTRNAVHRVVEEEKK